MRFPSGKDEGERRKRTTGGAGPTLMLYSGGVNTIRPFEPTYPERHACNNANTLIYAQIIIIPSTTKTAKKTTSAYVTMQPRLRNYTKGRRGRGRNERGQIGHWHSLPKVRE